MIACQQQPNYFSTEVPSLKFQPNNPPSSHHNQKAIRSNVTFTPHSYSHSYHATHPHVHMANTQVLFDSVGLDDPYVASFLYCAANLPGNLLVLLAVDRLGRRPLLLVSMFGAAASALLFAFASGNDRDEWVCIIFLFLCEPVKSGCCCPS
jgi:hypothetical protein